MEVTGAELGRRGRDREGSVPREVITPRPLRCPFTNFPDRFPLHNKSEVVSRHTLILSVLPQRYEICSRVPEPGTPLDRMALSLI